MWTNISCWFRTDHYASDVTYGNHDPEYLLSIISLTAFKARAWANFVHADWNG